MKEEESEDLIEVRKRALKQQARSNRIAGIAMTILLITMLIVILFWGKLKT
ncbi:hypothetical protein [Ekhidna sp.]